MILSGQLDFGRGTFWRIRDTYNYRPNKDHDYKMSVGYGQMNVNYTGSDIHLFPDAFGGIGFARIEHANARIWRGGKHELS